MTRTLLLVAALASTACKDYRARRFKEPMKLGGKVIPAGVLEEGQRDYMLYCRTCHGEKGDGKGPSALGLRPPPRDFTLGIFKFAAVPGGTLPHDEDVVRIVRSGLHGTAMLAWDGVPDPNLQAIIQYMKTFSPRWREEEPGDAVVPTPDPWASKAGEGVARGRKLYHGLAQCLGCHPAYASKQEIYEASRELTGNGTTDFRPDMYGSELKDSDYGVKILPPDFTFADVRSVRDDHRAEDLYRVIAAGVGGTAMPTWKGSLPDDDIWALAHYVDSLLALKGTPGVAELRRKNEAADAGWTAPPPAN
jgi:mono/diheme cytochrome c family protein